MQFVSALGPDQCQLGNVGSLGSLDGPYKMTRQQRPSSFVARIWLERGSNGDPIWRGHVRHVQGEQETYFQDLETMRDFLERVSGVTGPTLTAQPLKNVTKSESGTVTNRKQKH